MAVVFSGEERPAPLGVTGRYRGSTRAVQKRSPQETMGRREQDRYPEQAGGAAEG